MKTKIIILSLLVLTITSCKTNQNKNQTMKNADLKEFVSIINR